FRCRGIGAGRHLDPYRDIVRAAQAEEIVGHAPVVREPFKQCDPRLRVDETVSVERAYVALGCFARIAEDQLEMGICGNCRRRVGAQSSDVHALPNSGEEPCKRRRASFHESNSTVEGSRLVYATTFWTPTCFRPPIEFRGPRPPTRTF